MSKTGFEFMALLKVSKNESQKFPITITEFRRALVFLHPQYFAFSIHLLISTLRPSFLQMGRGSAPISPTRPDGMKKPKWRRFSEHTKLLCKFIFHYWYWYFPVFQLFYLA